MPENQEEQEREEAQVCFPAEDGDLICNYVVVRGKIIRSSKGWLKFTPKKSEKPSSDEELIA